jgi:tol-pal system protein YbgF
MVNRSKALVAGGLVILTGPLCLQALAQDYVDVEAERRAASDQPASSAPAITTTPQASDPYSARPAQSYPATSYGLDRAPAGPVVTAPAAGASTTPAVGSGGQNLGSLFLQLQQLQQDVMRLNGIVEEQANELRRLKEQSLERYVDLDKRLSAAAGAGVAGGATAATGSGGSNVAAVTPSRSSSQSQAAEQPGEAEAYRSAYALVRSQQFDQAVDAFKAFLQNYPDGRYAPNAHYWLGELYLVVQPPDLESSRQAFTLLLDEYPDNSKAPDAMYKLGKVHYMKGNRERAREYFDRVINEYGDGNSSAARLSRDFIEENY